MKRLAVPALFLFVWAPALVAGGPGSGADAALLRSLQHGALVPAARALTRLGDWTVLLAVTAAAAAWLLWKRLPYRALVLAGTLLSCRLLVDLQKLAFDRVRPDPQGHLIAVHTMAFPSGHAANSMVAFLAIPLILLAGSNFRLPAAAGGAALAILVGLSRPVLGVHWPSDVLGGWAFGAAWALLGARLALGTSPAARH